MTGSDRIVDNTTFAELRWGRDPFSAEFFILAPGFQKRADLFPEDFIEVLKDIHALQCIQDLPSYTCQNPIEMCRIDNQQASIGSRLLQESNDDLFWDDHPDLLMWILYTGGSFSPKGPTRSGFKALLQINHTLRFKAKSISLPELLEVLRQFVWSERMYRAQVEEFWEDIHTET
ncbi:hypothetical protein H2202_009456 [Exophiala xenobiotica]|nr:hypothetical protein H2202_009456 [Exophiala xenobiotica]